MKSLRILLIIAVVCLLNSSCNDDFLQKFPETNISGENFFNNAKDLEMYSNSFYEYLPGSPDARSYAYGPREDLGTDNQGGGQSIAETDNLVRGILTPETVGGWSKSLWGRLRNINFLLENANKPQGDMAEINNYIGIARFFRAWFYYDLIKRYGSAPWYSTTINTNDEELLMKKQDSRTVVVDSIMQDLEYAVANVTAGTSRTRVTKYAALSLLARVALYEGTYRKYHTELNLQSTANALLERAVWATEQIMAVSPAQYDITGSGADGYAVIFAGDLRNSKESILHMEFDRALGKINSGVEIIDRTWNLSKSLADTYLKLDGTPATSDPDYATKGFVEMFEDRDPRMRATIMPPGYIFAAENMPHLITLDMGGLPQKKYYTNDPTYNRGGWSNMETDFPIFRYGEVLLINAEAKAELGTITQDVLDKTINRLRDRVSMVHMDMNVPVDPVLENQYPDVSGNMKNVILEIRRERRVELACEGLRQEDIRRWAAGHLLAQAPEGIYFEGFGAIDCTGDGIPNVALLRSPSAADRAPIADLPAEVQTALSIYYLFDANGIETAIYLSEGDKGNIRFTRDKNLPRTFISPKYYYFPIPWEQTRDNPNLDQPPGW